MNMNIIHSTWEKREKHTISYKSPSYHGDMARIKWSFKLFQHHVSKETLSSFILLPGIENVYFVFIQKEHLLLHDSLWVTCSCKNKGTSGRIWTKKSGIFRLPRITSSPFKQPILTRPQPDWPFYPFCLKISPWHIIFINRIGTENAMALGTFPKDRIHTANHVY